MAPNLHDQTAQRHGDNHHMYASLAPSWPLSVHHHHPAPSSGPSSVMLQRQLPGFHHAAPSDYVNIPPFQTVWQPTSFYRPGWTDPLPDDGFATRPPAHQVHQVHYSEGEGNGDGDGDGDGDGEAAPAVPHPQPDTAIARTYPPPREQQPSHYVRYSEEYHPPAQHQDFPPAPMEYGAPAPPTVPQTVPPFQTDVQRAAPVAHLLNYTPSSTAAIHGQPSTLVPQPSMDWPVHGSDMAVVPHQDFSHSHSNVAIPSSMVVSAPDSIPHAPWVNAAGMDSSTMHHGYERLPGIHAGWVLMQAPTGEADYVHSAQSHQLPSIPAPPPHHRPRRGSSKPKQPTTKVASSFIPRQTKVKVSKRKGPLDINSRRKASLMRRNKVCIRCKMYKAGCDDGDPCQKCRKSCENARSFLEPCFRDHIQDTSLVRRCNGRCNQVEADFLKYVWQENGSIFTMEIIWYLPGTSAPIRMNEPLRIRCRGYYIDEADRNSVASVWKNTDGRVIDIRQPPYAIFDTAALQADVDAYFAANWLSMEQWIHQRICRDDLALLTYREAWRLRDQGLIGNNILDLTLRLQCLSIMSQGYGTVSSSDIPGIREYDFRQLGHSEYEAYDRNSRDRPLPAAINHQMDVAFVKILKRLEQECHKVLDERVFKPKIKPWYELFLTFFTLFWHLGYIHHSADQYIRSKDGIRDQSHVGSVVRQQIKKWDDTFEIILRYWRTLLRTFVPFKVARENPQDLHAKGHLPDAEAFNYMIQAVAIFDRAGIDRHMPPLTGGLDAQFSMRSKYIVALFKDGGA